MRLKLDVVIARCFLTLDELTHLQIGQVKPLTDFIQSTVMLQSGGEVLATGVLIQVDDEYFVSIEKVNGQVSLPESTDSL